MRWLCRFSFLFVFFFLMLRRPPRSTLFPTRRSSDLFLEPQRQCHAERAETARREGEVGLQDRKSTRLNSSHPSISYAVFCLKKKKKKKSNRKLKKKEKKQKRLQ